MRWKTDWLWRTAETGRVLFSTRWCPGLSPGGGLVGGDISCRAGTIILGAGSGEGIMGIIVRQSSVINLHTPLPPLQRSFEALTGLEIQMDTDGLLFWNPPVGALIKESQETKRIKSVSRTSVTIDDDWVTDWRTAAIARVAIRN